MNLKRRFKKSYARELLSVAYSDLDTASVLIAGHVKRKENTLYHLQQAIEKGLKALLCFREIEIPMIHDLSLLVREVPGDITIPHDDKIFDLTQFATIRRYEEGVAIITDDEISAVFQMTQDILDFLSQIINVTEAK